MIGAGRTPVHQHSVGVALDPLDEHVVIRPLPTARHLHGYNYHSPHIHELRHNLVESLGAERAVGADMDDHNIAKLAGVVARAHQLNRGHRLSADLSVDLDIGDDASKLFGRAN